MKRKVVKHGPSTFIISLPLKWVKERKIKKGDELEVTEKGDNIEISSEGKNKTLNIRLDAKDLLPILVDRFLARAYQKGYDQIEIIIHDDIELLKTIQTKVHELMGYEIIEQSNKRCIIKSITSNMEIDFNSSLRRAFLIIKQLMLDCYNKYKENDIESLKHLYLQDLEINKLCYFCLRQINKKQYKEIVEEEHQANVLYYIIEMMEDLGDNYKKLATLLSRSGSISDTLLGLLKKLNVQYDISYNYFYSPKKEMANKAYLLFKEIEADISKKIQKTPSPDEITALIFIKECSHIIYHFTTMRLDFLKEAHITR